MITKAGLDLIAPLDAPLIDAHRRALGYLSPNDLKNLIQTLERVREALQPDLTPESSTHQHNLQRENS